jgi:hypothetical protein
MWFALREDEGCIWYDGLFGANADGQPETYMVTKNNFASGVSGNFSRKWKAAN